MIVHVFIRASTYRDAGWAYEFVEDTEHPKYYYDNNNYTFLGKIEAPDPKVSQLVEIGLNKVEAMKQAAAEDALQAQENIKDYEAKFLMLEEPVTPEELS